MQTYEQVESRSTPNYPRESGRWYAGVLLENAKCGSGVRRQAPGDSSRGWGGVRDLGRWAGGGGCFLQEALGICLAWRLVSCLGGGWIGFEDMEGLRVNPFW